MYVEACPGPSVTGTVAPEIPKPLPEAEIWEIVTLTFPVLLTTKDFVPLFPTMMLPKLMLVGLVESCATGAAAPVPVSERLVGEFGAVLTSATLPLAVPEAAGEKVTTKDVLAPAASVNGRVIPLAAKPEPVAVACEIVRLALPVFAITTDFDEELPAATLPKFKEVGFRERAGLDGAVAITLSPTDIGDAAALLAIDSVPENVPAL